MTTSRRQWGWWPAALVVAIGGYLAAGAAFGGGTGSPPSVDGSSISADVPAAHTPSRALTATLGGTDAVTRAMGPGLGCNGRQPVDDVHLLLESSLPSGVFSQLTGTARANLGISTATQPQGLSIPNRLEPSTSHITLGNDRGTLQLRLGGGGCPTRNLTGPSEGPVAGTGALTLVGGTGAYRDATFTEGAWDLSTAIDPGADNAWSLGLNGQVAVLAPDLDVDVLATNWGNAGVDYVLRTVTVVYRITNSGAGDAYGASLISTSSTQGVTSLGPTPQPLGDLLSGESVDVSVRYRLALLGPPCALVLLGCNFATTLSVGLPDALDVPATYTATVPVTAPDLPPPLEGGL